MIKRIILILVLMVPLIGIAQTSSIPFTKHIVDDNNQTSAYTWAADLDGDGDIDIIAGSYGDQLYWYENDGNQEFTKNVVSPDLEGVYDVQVSDFDNDGDQDIYGFSNDLAITYIYENDGSQNFTKKTTLSLFGAHQVFTRDFNGDGKLNIVKWGAPITWYEGSGSGTYIAHTVTPVTNVNTYFAGDIDGDRDVDWIVRDTITNTTHTIINDQSGINTKSSSAITFEYVDFTFFGDSKDVDSDGDLDLIAHSIARNEVYWYENDGNFNYTRHIIDTTIVYPWLINATDLNEDGKLEIVVSDYYDGAVISYENDGNQNFTKTRLGEIYTPLGHFIADIDNDSDEDVVVNGTFDNSIVWFENMLITPNTDNHAYQSPNLGNHNYIYTITPQKEMPTIDNTTVKVNSDVIESVGYFDGLGRSTQTVAMRAGGNGEDLITKIEYDAFGRQVKDFLPFAEASNQGEKYRPNIDLNGFYKTKYAEDFANTAVENINPYSEKVLEASPLNRILEQGAPGDAWKADDTSDTDHTIKFNYNVNIAGEVRLFDVTYTDPNNTEAPSLTENSTYGQGELYKTVTKDENWQPGQTHDKDHTTEEFKDKQGMVVLKRTYNNNQTHDTYYVYDDYGNLTYVIPPKAADNATIDQPILDELCYQYKYDYRNRLIEKKIPGKGWESIVYDRLDRPVLTQDANLNTQSVWLFTKYDAFGRVAYTGKYTTADDRATLQATFTGKQNPEDNYEVSDTSTTGYSNVDFPNANLEILTINYYDDYNFNGVVADPITVFDEDTTDKVKGLATGSKVKVLDTTDDWITTVTYYDEKARPIYVHTQNDYLNTTDIVQTDLDFTGRALKVRTSHIYNNEPELVTLDTFTYDQMGRVLKQVQCIGGASLEDDCGDLGAEGIENTLFTTETVNPGVTKAIEATDAIILEPGFEASPKDGQVVEIQIKEGTISGKQGELIAENTYDELGQLVQKNVGNIESAPLQKVGYAYNVRGWLKNINEDTDATDNDLFNFTIRYNDAANSLYALYNGNISETLWSTASDNAATSNNPVSNQYTYTYDALNRIISATDNTGNYTLGGITNPIVYDKNGNIESLRRQGHTTLDAQGKVTGFGVMDDLSYTYDAGNKLLSVTEQNGASTQYGFKDGTNTGNDYAYDANGNMTQDLNKGIGVNGISYNHLNLPIAIDFGGGNKIEYIYDASGIKLQKKVTEGSSLNTTDYAGNYIYKDANLEFFNHPEGYVTKDGTGYKYIYQYKDHLDNIRLSYADNNGSIEIIEENNYYPFGLEHKGYNNVVSSNSNSAASKYRYNGKEIQEELGLNMYDYGARNYDPALGRWFGVDALAEDYQSSSPYGFVGNNPITNLEIDGRFWIRTVGEDGTVTYTAEDGDSAWSLHQQFGEQDGISAKQADQMVQDIFGPNIVKNGTEYSNINPEDEISVYNEQESTETTTTDESVAETQESTELEKLDSTLNTWNPVLKAGYKLCCYNRAKNAAAIVQLYKDDPENAEGLVMTQGQASVTANAVTPGLEGGFGGIGSRMGNTRRSTRVSATGQTVTVSGRTRNVQQGSQGGRYYISKNGKRVPLNRDGTKRN